MIQLSDILSRFQSQLNGLGNREFVIFSDVGEFQKAYREEGSNTIDRYVNGVGEMISQTILPIKNLQAVTETIRVTFLADMDLLEKDENGNFVEVLKLRELFEKYIKKYNGVSYFLTEGTGVDRIEYEITPSFNGVTVGVASQMSPIGNVLPIYFDFSCIIVESGVSVNSIHFIVNGEDMFFNEYSATRTRVAETSMVANKQTTKTYAQSNGLSLQLSTPLIKGKKSELIEDDVWEGGQNRAICVERFNDRRGTKGKSNAYIMILGNNSESGTIGQNVGQIFNLVEGKRELLEYRETDGWHEIEVVVENAGNQSVLFPAIATLPGQTAYRVIFWQDGTFEKNTSSTAISHYFAEPGTYIIRCFQCAVG